MSPFALPDDSPRLEAISLRITVLGSGTSTGVPVIGCGCEVCRSDKPENKRLRCSIYVEHPGGGFLVDCSTDFRQQALRYRIPSVDALLLTHDHADHINGIDDLRAYNFLQQYPISIYASGSVIQRIERCYDYCFNPVQMGGGVPRLELQEIYGGQSFRVDGVEIIPIPIKHGLIDIFGFRIGRDFAYLTDCSAVGEEAYAMLEGVQVLIVDALRPHPHPTHFGLDQAVECANRVGAQETWFTHMTCRLEHFATNAALPPGKNLLHDGQIIQIGAPFPLRERLCGNGPV